MRGVIVLGGMVIDNGQVDNPSGVIRAFDAVTGKLAWAWDLGRPDVHRAPGSGEQYTRNTPNGWAPFSADESLGLVYVPTGNSTGQELWKTSLSAAAFATPMIYSSARSGRQYVVVPVGGNSKFGPNDGLYVDAYALP